MKSVAISELYRYNIVINEVSVISQMPTWKTIGGLGAAFGPRMLNGFLLIKEGGCYYKWHGGESELHHGDLIYLPSGAQRYVSVIGEERLSYYRINLRVFDKEDGEEIVFSPTPFVLKSVSHHFLELCERMVATTLSVKNNLKTMSLMYELLSSIAAIQDRSYDKRVLSAVNYVEQHYTEDFDVSLLAELCFISQAQLFRLFKKEVGETPIEYRTTLRIQRAKDLLGDEECRIGDVADILGFESIYYFSRAFKKRVGVSPSEYRRKFMSLVTN